MSHNPLRGRSIFVNGLVYRFFLKKIGGNEVSAPELISKGGHKAPRWMINSVSCAVCGAKKVNASSRFALPMLFTATPSSLSTSNYYFRLLAVLGRGFGLIIHSRNRIGTTATMSLG